MIYKRILLRKHLALRTRLTASQVRSNSGQRLGETKSTLILFDTLGIAMDVTCSNLIPVKSHLKATCTMALPTDQAQLLARFGSLLSLTLVYSPSDIPVEAHQSMQANNVAAEAHRSCNSEFYLLPMIPTMLKSLRSLTRLLNE